MGLFLALLVACTESRVEPDSKEASGTLESTRGVLLISIDTLRADHLGAYGYERDTSPFLDSLSEHSVVFEHALAQIPSTLPSHVSMLTGLYPKEHRVFPPNGVIPSSIETLAETFQRSGYRTAGFTDGGYMSRGFGFDRGFDEFADDFGDGPTNRSVERIFARGLDFLRSLNPADPYFLFLHTYAVHDPYDPPEPYRREFLSGAAPIGLWEPTGPNLSRFNCGHETLGPEGREHFIALYDAGIRYVDDVLGDFFKQLEAAGLADELTVIITSDHGEEFLEHRLVGHAQVFHHNLHVPLLIHHPDATPGRVRGVARLVDLVPTLADLAGLELKNNVAGRSLRPSLERGASPMTNESYAQASVGGGTAIYRVSKDDRILQYVRQPHRGNWVTPRGLVFDAIGPRTSVISRAFLKPRGLRIEVDGLPEREILVERLITAEGSQPVQTIEIELPDDGRKHRVGLFPDDCAPASEIGAVGDCRCLALQIAGVPEQREEIYEVVDDPLEQADLTLSIPAEPVAPLARALEALEEGFEDTAAAATETHELSPEVRVRLEALGYL